MNIESVSGEFSKIKPGFYRMPDELYFNGPGLSQSSLKKILESPAHFYLEVTNPPPPTEAMTIGTLVHHAFLEPELFTENYTVRPPGTDRRTKAGKEKYTEWEKSKEGKTEIKGDHRDTALSCAEALGSHPKIAKIIKDAEKEIVAYAGFGDVQARAKIDIARFDKHAIFDLKTTADCSPREFKKSIHKYGYDFQMAWYAAIYEELTGVCPNCAIIAIEPKPPFPVTLHHIGEAWLAKGRRKYKRALKRFEECTNNDEWPGYSGDICLSEPDEWMIREDAI